MKKKLFVAFVCMLGFLKLSAQVNPDPAEIDTADIIKNLLLLLDSTDAPVSYTSISLSGGNRLFSLNNNRLNAKQETNNTMVYNPSVGYYHKSGISITAGASLLNDVTNGFGVNQYSLNAAYDHINDSSFSYGFSYSRYFVKDHFSPYSSPVQNDWYGQISYNKKWLQPGLALGYSTGEYKQVKKKDTVINNIKRTYYDSATFSLRSFSVMLSINHKFKWEQVLDKNDDLIFTPSLMLNMGSSVTNISHKTNAQNLLNFLNKRGKLPRLLSSSFQAESLGFNLDLLYNVGNFSFEPELYLDYYLPQTDTKRFSQLFTFSVAYSF